MRSIWVARVDCYPNWRKSRWFYVTRLHCNRTWWKQCVLPCFLCDQWIQMRCIDGAWTVIVHTPNFRATLGHFADLDLMDFKTLARDILKLKIASLKGFIFTLGKSKLIFNLFQDKFRYSFHQIENIANYCAFTVSTLITGNKQQILSDSIKVSVKLRTWEVSYDADKTAMFTQNLLHWTSRTKHVDLALTPNHLFRLNLPLFQSSFRHLAIEYFCRLVPTSQCSVFKLLIAVKVLFCRDINGARTSEGDGKLNLWRIIINRTIICNVNFNRSQPVFAPKAIKFQRACWNLHKFYAWNPRVM